MKIDSKQRTQHVAAPEREGRRSTGSRPARSHEPAAQVERSSFMRSLDDADPGAVRQDLVRSVRAAIANGTFEASVDLDKVVDSLLAEL